MRTITTHYHDIDTERHGGLSLELPYAMSPIMEYKSVLVKETAEGVTIGYLADDSDCSDPQDDDGFGHIYEARRNGPTLAMFNQTMGIDEYGQRFRAPDPFAVMLDYYEHGLCSYSIAGEGMQCRFDTVKGNVVWVPSTYLRKELLAMTAGAQEQAREWAKQAAEQYTDWRNGSCYGVVVATYDAEGSLQHEDACWGFIGDDYAYDSLKSDYFPQDPA